MNDGPPPLKLTRLHGFAVRPPTSSEVPALLDFFRNCPLGREQLSILGAFGQPGNIPLGAAIIRGARRGGKRIGHFDLFVRIDSRRNGIGAALMHHLYRFASEKNADRLILAELVHQDREENAFCREVGLSPERSFGTYVLPIDQGIAKTCAPAASRFERSHPHFTNARVVPLAELDVRDVARFITDHYTGFVDHRVEQLNSGYYDLSLSQAATRSDGGIFAIALFRSNAQQQSIMLDLLLAAEPFRNGPVPMVLLVHAEPVATTKGYTHVVFEADENYDRFAVGAAKCCGESARWFRHRYAIDKLGIAQQLGGKNITSPTR